MRRSGAHDTSSANPGLCCRWRSGGPDSCAVAGPRRRSTLLCWKSTMTSCATSAATPCIRRRCGSWMNWGSSMSSCVYRTPRSPESPSTPTATLRTFGNFSALKWLGFKQPYIALMPQWDFLDFLAEKASAYPEFTLIRNAEVKDVIFEGDRVVGVRTPNWRCMRSWWSAPTDAHRRCAPRRVWRSERDLPDRCLVVPAEMAPGRSSRARRSNP